MATSKGHRESGPGNEGLKSRFPRSDFSKIRPRSIRGRRAKVNLGHLGEPFRPGCGFSEFLDSLPDVLAARNLKRVVDAVVKAHGQGLPRIFMMGGHVIKCGLGPVLVQLMERGVITTVAGNGSVAIHDFELAMWGQTSEDVAETLGEGSFGMTGETAERMNAAIRRGQQEDRGMGECLGEALLEDAPHADRSVLANAVRLAIPVTIHVGIGTDTIHQHGSASGAALGETSYRDFRVFTRQVEELRAGSVILNLGSAVILPEVFLKALSIARNLGRPAKGFVAANFDMLTHYRPRENVIRRPTEDEGEGYGFIGQHEILLPLFFGAILEDLEPDSG